ncbi:MAG: hypothetical protein IPM69_07025 [Ignavibacteria bacterium]|nr:hypothetical protein [Ignavibacteria bacterium]
MEVSTLISEIQHLPLTERFFVVEETIKSIKKEELHRHMDAAAHQLRDEYLNNDELVAFTSLDLEQFYEAK